MNLLHPLMGQRRQLQMNEAIVNYIPNRNFGESHPQARLTAEKVSEIKRRLEEGEQLVRLVVEFGVDKGLIWQIQAGRIWRHVT